MKSNFFDAVNSWIRNTETSVVNAISAIAPWLAPLAPAFMTYQHATDTLKFPIYISIPSAIVVEILGFSTVSTVLAFWFHNRKRQAEFKRAPVEIAIASFVFYLSLILVSNVILDWFDGAKGAVITVRALFTLQSIPAALIVAVRTQHRDMLANIEKSKAEKSGVRNDSQKDTDESEQGANKARTFASLTPEEKEYILKTESKKASKKFNVTVRAIQKWKLRIEKKLPVNS